jgi:hypothetical protein
MPNNYWEKIECWESLMKIKEVGLHNNCIIAGDFNTTLHQGGKKRRLYSKGPIQGIHGGSDLRAGSV